MKKIVTVVGARPQFVKTAVVSRAIRQQNQLEEVLVHTGQHYDNNMSQIFFDELEIPAIHYHLGVGSGTQGKQTSDMLFQIERVLMDEKPDWLLIYGDTNSTLAAALAAAKLHIPIGHVEAGLRSFNRKMPEEVNRIVADQLSAALFTPTEQAVTNLKHEGYDSARIIAVGDVMLDAAQFYGEKAVKSSQILQTLKLNAGDYVLATVHRAENTNHLPRLQAIFSALNRLCNTMPVVLPLHPRTRQIIEKQLPELIANSQITIIEPLGFLDMMMLEKNAALIMTDSGGVQKEAFFYQIPCITLRDETEWVETVALQWNKIVKPENSDEIYQQALNSLGSKGMQHQHPYGQGNAAHLITQYLHQGVC